MLAGLLVLLFSGPAVEARHWGHHRHYDYGEHYNWDDQEQDPIRGRQHADREIGPPARQDTGFTAAVQQLITGCRQASTELKRLSVNTLASNLATNDGQRGTLNDMQGAAVEVADRLSSTCPSDLPPSTSGKMQALAEVTRSYLAAVDALQPKVGTFYASLTDEQKARLVALDLSNRGIDGNPSFTGDAKGTAFCEQWTHALRSWPTRQLEARISLSDSQHAALFDVAAAMYRSADGLANACPKEMPLSPPGQFDARRKQLAALLQAIDGIIPVLERFSNILDDAQKTALDTVVNAS